MYKDYKENIHSLSLLSDISCRMSIETAGRVVSGRSEEIYSWIFAKIGINSISVLRILPKSRYYKALNNVNSWDLSSVAALTRLLIEAYLVPYYLCIGDEDNEVSKLKVALWDLNAISDRLKMANWNKVTRLEVSQLRNQKKYQKKKIKKSIKENVELLEYISKDLFNKYPPGERAVYAEQYQLVKAAGLKEECYNTIYKTLSTFAHTEPYAIEVLETFRPDNESAMRYLTEIIKYYVYFLGLAILDFVEAFPDQSKLIENDNIKRILNECECLKNSF